MSEFLNNWFTTTSAVNISLVVMAIIVIMLLIRWHTDGSDFQLQQALVDSVTKKIAIEKVGYMMALLLGSWGFIALILTNKMTEGYFMGYLGIFAAARAVSSGISVAKDVKLSGSTDKSDPSK